MSEPQTASTEQPDEQPELEQDPNKEAMRRALDAKNAARHQGEAGVSRKKSIGGPHGKEGGSRQFRRKSGG